MNTKFEKGVESYLTLLHSQVCEAHAQHAILRDEQGRLGDACSSSQRSEVSRRVCSERYEEWAVFT